MPKCRVHHTKPSQIIFVISLTISTHKLEDFINISHGLALKKSQFYV